MKLNLLQQQTQALITLSYKGERKKLFEIYKNMKKIIEDIKKENA